MSKAINKSSSEFIEQRILLFRGKRVMLDSHLAELYGVSTKQLNRQVRRNIERFPDDFMFQLNAEEYEILRCQFGTSSYGGRRYLPLVFTDYGILMLSSVLNSDQAVQANIQIMRVFVKLREMIKTHKDLWKKIQEMEQKYDQQFKSVFDTFRQLLIQEEKPRRRMGFHTEP